LALTNLKHDIFGYRSFLLTQKRTKKTRPKAKTAPPRRG